MKLRKGFKAWNAVFTPKDLCNFLCGNDSGIRISDSKELIFWKGETDVNKAIMSLSLKSESHDAGEAVDVITSEFNFSSPHFLITKEDIESRLDLVAYDILDLVIEASGFETDRNDLEISIDRQYEYLRELCAEISSLEDDDENRLNIERSKGDSDYDCTQQCKEEKKARATHTGKIENECQGLQASLFLHEYKQNFTGLQRYVSYALGESSSLSGPPPNMSNLSLFKNPKIAGLAKHLAKDLIASIEEEIDGAGVTVSHDPEQDKLILSTKNEELINCLKEVSKLQRQVDSDQRSVNALKAERDKK
ncbi:hypothetical protein Tco_0543561 [Tanacetum coccineum]